ncbi:MAG: M48 family metalloprotease [Pseudomonadales bacterium]|nr:M48 family metalloprotease [Pseudomonadales bacterium]
MNRGSVLVRLASLPFKCMVGGLVLLSFIAGCAVNPVTGKRELSLVSRQQEISIGQEQYLPSQQMQGGQYTVDDSLTAYVNSVGQKLAAFSEVELPFEFVVLNNSVPNAWALPGGKIALNRGLLTELKNEAELAAVLGHEIAHATVGHGAQSMERGMLLQGAMVAAMVGSSGSKYGAVVVGAGQLGASLITTKYGRDAEREADYYGTAYLAKAGYDPRAAINLQETFVRLSEGRKQNWLSGLFASHPPSQERVENNRIRAAELGENGKLGQAEFETAMAYLKSKKSAYDAYDEAQKKVKEKKWDAAAALVGKAISLEGADSTFHGLRGNIRYRQNRYTDAVVNYDRAIQRDDAYFAWYLGRGLSQIKLNHKDKAKVDLELSLGILPTATAYNELGHLAEDSGNEDAALRYYAQAAKSNSTAGKQAAGRYLGIDLTRQPAVYITARIINTASGAALWVKNDTAFKLSKIQIRVLLTWVERMTDNYIESIAIMEPGAERVIALKMRNSNLVDANAYAVSASLLK